KLGIPTIPIPHGQKVPQFPWKEYQMKVPSERDLKRWYGLRKPSNYAIITGKMSGLVAVDADSPEAVTFIEANLPKTPWINVTARGRQYLYRHPGVHIRNRARIKTANGPQDIDIRADGGFVIGPGSTHPTGVKYRPEGDWSVDPTSLPIFPTSILTNGVSQHGKTAAGNGHQSLTGGETIQRARAYLAKIQPAVEGA